MQKKIRTVAFFAMLSMLAVSCQKENELDYQPLVEAGVQDGVYLMSYSVDGTNYHSWINDSSAYREFVYQMLTLAEHGHEVTFADASKIKQIASKEAVTYTTTDKDDAFAWADKMIADGYRVTVSFDSKTGVYNCLARK